MPQISRQDGEIFIIPSYRDTLAAKKSSLLKREILLLSDSYGEYIALQKKNSSQYEVAFSTEAGTLLGESIWQYFQRPRDLIYCERIANKAEAILVIVKSGSVYLDGAFPLESIEEELIIFQTQQNNFEIYIHGEVPLAESGEEGVFALPAATVKSFKILDKPVFPTLPSVKAFRLQLVDEVLKSNKIGTFPINQVIALFILIGIMWGLYSFISKPAVQVVEAPIAPMVDEYAKYIQTLASPAPTDEINQLIEKIILLHTIPGWSFSELIYEKGYLHVKVISMGARSNLLYQWADQNKGSVSLKADGFSVSFQLLLHSRPRPEGIYPLEKTVASLIDRLSYVLPGNPLKMRPYVKQGKFMTSDLEVAFSEITPDILRVIGQQFNKLPLALNGVKLSSNGGNLSGTIMLTALGN